MKQYALLNTPQSAGGFPLYLVEKIQNMMAFVFSLFKFDNKKSTNIRLHINCLIINHLITNVVSKCRNDKSIKIPLHISAQCTNFFFHVDTR